MSSELSSEIPVAPVDALPVVPESAPKPKRKSRTVGKSAAASSLPLDSAQELSGHGAAVPKKKVSAKALRNLKLWREACYKVQGVRRTVRTTSPQYAEVQSLFKTLLADPSS